MTTSVFSNPKDQAQWPGVPWADDGGDAAPPPPATMGTPASMAPGVPQVFAAPPDMPSVQRLPTNQEKQIADTDHQIDENDAGLRALQYKDDNPYGSANNHPGFGGKLLHVLSKIGNTAGNILAPSAMMLTPGTDLNRQARENQFSQRALTLAKSADDQRQAAALTDYTQQRPEIEQAKIDEKQQAVRDRITQAAAKAGQKVAFDENGMPTYEDDPELQAFQATGTRMVLDQAKTERERVLAQVGEPGTPLYEQKQRELQQIDRRIAIAQQQLKLRGDQFDFDQNKFYDPQPNGTERSRGDLAQSGLMQLQTMREIANRRNDQFGPGAGSVTHFQNWLGSEDPDAAKYRAAQTFMAEHGAGVFGSRNMGVITDNKKLVDQRQNVDALNGAFDQAQQTFQHFADAGAIHGRPAVGGGHASGAPAMITARDPQGKLHQAPAGSALPAGWTLEKK